MRADVTDVAVVVLVCLNSLTSSSQTVKQFADNYMLLVVRFIRHGCYQLKN